MKNEQLVQEVFVDDVLSLWKGPGHWMWDAASGEMFQMRGMLVNFMHDYPGYTNTTDQMGTNAFQGCVKCDLQGRGLKLKKMVYAHRLQVYADDDEVREPVARTHDSIMKDVQNLEVTILNYVCHWFHLVASGFT